MQNMEDFFLKKGPPFHKVKLKEAQRVNYEISPVTRAQKKKSDEEREKNNDYGSSALSKWVDEQDIQKGWEKQSVGILRGRYLRSRQSRRDKSHLGQVRLGHDQEDSNKDWLARGHMALAIPLFFVPSQTHTHTHMHTQYPFISGKEILKSIRQAPPLKTNPFFMRWVKNTWSTNHYRFATRDQLFSSLSLSFFFFHFFFLSSVQQSTMSWGHVSSSFFCQCSKILISSHSSFLPLSLSLYLSLSLSLSLFFSLFFLSIFFPFEIFHTSRKIPHIKEFCFSLSITISQRGTCRGELRKK